VRIIKGNIPFLNYHFNRLKNGLAVLQIETPNDFSIAFFLKEIVKLTGTKRSARVRFTAYRENGGLYTPAGNKLKFIISAKALQQESYALSTTGLQIGIFDAIPLTYNTLSPLKTTNALPYILAAKYKKDHQKDDVLLLNNFGRIAEGSSSNLFLWDGEKLVTPRLKEACIAGVIRSVLLERTFEFGLNCKEGKIKTEDIMKAKALFLTNSIQGVKWIRKFEKKTYDPRLAKRIGNILLAVLKT